uniref:ScMYB72 protein n=1 Tax=Saccharum hybrid cultivar Co 86032 TaxID=672234 RepID=A0A0C6WCU3_9POAL|nr:ScMYB72 protein [Saccharum hybrid cultivar Co 86032]
MLPKCAFCVSLEPCPVAEIPASEKLECELAEDSRLQCMGVCISCPDKFWSSIDWWRNTSTTKSLILLKIAGSNVLNSPPQLTQFSEIKQGAENFASPSFAVVAKDSMPPSLEFTSPAHTVANI